MTQSKFTTLADLIAQVESGGNQYALRFESAHNPYDNKIATMATLCKCSRVTAKVLCQMSFGLFQIMGDNLVDLGLSTNVFLYCDSIATQNEMFNRYCIHNNCEYTLDDILNDQSLCLDFAKKYNGPGQPEVYAKYLVDTYSQMVK
ncbi:MAG TPA: N-acetylmuramidase domain-containing protein [Dehalococcoidia bacterium]|nr:N-acetylmuramidase domain-containing protein [Dehalococcoidia bacterium]